MNAEKYRPNEEELSQLKERLSRALDKLLEKQKIE